MKRAVLLVLLASLVAATALVIRYPHLMVAPGRLVPAHAELATDCFACHQVLAGTPAARCTECHKIQDIGMRTTRGKVIGPGTLKLSFHQTLLRQDCTACHSEHEGVRKFRAGPVFSHASLEGDLRRRCEDCHRAPGDNLHARISGGCRQCHSESGWTPATFEHDKHFELDRDHNVRCATCHERADYSTYTCYGCHEHAPLKVRAKHLKEGIRDFDNCVECHRNAREEPHREGRSRDGERGQRGGHD